MTIDRPEDLRINAWDGTESSILDFPNKSGNPFLATRVGHKTLAPVHLPKPWDWRSKDVGWGLILRDNPAISAKDKAVGADAPEPIRRLLAARAYDKHLPAPVLRYQPNKPPGTLHRYYPDGTDEQLSSATPERGVREGQIPQYLLIYGGPVEVPWSVQYGLNLSAYVGRLDLTVEEGLNHYVGALISDWKGLDLGDAYKPVVWSPDWGIPDITFLLSQLLGAKLSEKFATDGEMRERVWLTGAQASCAGARRCTRGAEAGFYLHDKSRHDRPT